jgi:hypothetical protein
MLLNSCRFDAAAAVYIGGPAGRAAGVCGDKAPAFL